MSVSRHSKKCCVPGCLDNSELKHRFPKCDVLFRKWIEQIRNPVLDNLPIKKVYDLYRVCNIHFSDEFKINVPSRKKIKTIAYPTLYLPGKYFFTLLL